MIFFWMLIVKDHGEFSLSNEETEELNELYDWKVVSIESLPKEPMQPEAAKLWIQATNK